MYSPVKQLTVHEFKKMLDAKDDVLLIDVRNPDEYEYANLEGKLIPMNEIPEKMAEIPKDKPVIVHCHHGSRSKRVIEWLKSQDESYDNLYNLEGGIHAWACEIDTNVPIY
jgi:adenylyltransferase/sulfurtransferase